MNSPQSPQAKRWRVAVAELCAAAVQVLSFTFPNNHDPTASAIEGSWEKGSSYSSTAMSSSGMKLARAMATAAALLEESVVALLVWDLETFLSHYLSTVLKSILEPDPWQQQPSYYNSHHGHTGSHHHHRRQQDQQGHQQGHHEQQEQPSSQAERGAAYHLYDAGGALTSATGALLSDTGSLLSGAVYNLSENIFGESYATVPTDGHPGSPAVSFRLGEESCEDDGFDLVDLIGV